MNFHDHAFHNSSVVAYGFMLSEGTKTNTLANKYIQLFYTASDTRKALACAAHEVQVLITEPRNESMSASFEVSPLNLAAALHSDNPLRDIYLEKSEPNALFISRALAAGARGVVSHNDLEGLLGVQSTSGERSHSDAVMLAPPVTISELPIETAPLTDEAYTFVAPRTYDEAYPIEAVSFIEESNPGDESYFTEESRLLDALQHAETGFYEGAAYSAQAAQHAETVQMLESMLPTPSPTTLPVDTAWLEQVLDLDDLDELSLGNRSTLIEKPPSYQTSQLKQQVPESRECLQHESQKEGGGIVAAFVSGRGGVGKSSLTVLTALDLWQKGLKVAVLDMDLQFGDVSILAGNEPESRIQRLNIEQLCKNRVKVPAIEGSLLLLEAPGRPELAEELIHQIPRFFTELRTVADIVLVNTACLWNEAAAVLASIADKLVICMDQRATSLSAARQVVDLCARLHIPSTQLYYLLNRSERTAPITDIDASLAMGGAEILTIAEGGADVDELLSLGCPLELLSAVNTLRQSIHKLGSSLLERPGAQAEAKGSKR